MTSRPTTAPSPHDPSDDLDRELTRYREMTLGRRNTSPAVKAGGFATAAGSALALAGGAEAAIIYSGPQFSGISVTSFIPPPGSGSFSTNLRFGVDIDQDGNEDFDLGLNAQRFTYTSSSASFMSSSGGAYFVPDPFASPKASFIRDGANLGPLELSSGNTIGPGANFGTTGGALNYGSNVALYSSPVMGYWGGSQSGLIGFKLNKAGGDVHYGWIRIKLFDEANNQDPNGAPEGISDGISIVDWAYEDSPNTPIAAGAIPEPSGLTLFAAGAASLPYWRRRKEKRDARRRAAAQAE